MNSISSTTSAAASTPVDAAQPDDGPISIPTGTGPYAPPSDGVDLPGPADRGIFGDGTSTTVTCPAGTNATIVVSGQEVKITCEPPKGKGGPSPAPILD